MPHKNQPHLACVWFAQHHDTLRQFQQRSQAGFDLPHTCRSRHCRSYDQCDRKCQLFVVPHCPHCIHDPDPDYTFPVTSVLLDPPPTGKPLP